MTATDGLVFKRATEDWEFDQVHRLNYRTFAEEIHQHERNEKRVLVDSLLSKSACFIALRGGRVVGMIAICDQRPFSLDRKIPDLDAHLPGGLGHVSEVRLLAVDPDERRGPVFGGLMGVMLRHAKQAGIDSGIISAHVSQRQLYERLGFQPFGPPLGTPDVPFQGMCATWHTLAESMGRIATGQAPTEEHAS